MDNYVVYIPHNALGDKNKRYVGGMDSLCYMHIHAVNYQPVFRHILANWQH